MLQTKLIPLWNRYTYNLILNFLGGGGGFFFLIDMPLIIRYIFFKEIDFVDFFCAKMRINFAFMYNSLLHVIKKPLENFLKNTY